MRLVKALLGRLVGPFIWARSTAYGRSRHPPRGLGACVRSTVSGLGVERAKTIVSANLRGLSVADLGSEMVLRLFNFAAIPNPLKHLVYLMVNILCTQILGLE